MNPNYWRESFTRRYFLSDCEELPADAVRRVTEHVQDLQRSFAHLILRLHGKRWHHLCFYPLRLKSAADCPACKLIADVEHLLLLEVYGHISGVVIDFFHGPGHKDQLEEAVRLYAWAVFHMSKPRSLVREGASLVDFARHRVGDLYDESFVHKPLSSPACAGLTTEEDLERLAGIFASAYASLVEALDAWRRTHVNVTDSAFPAE